MNLLEFEAKQLFREAGIPIPAGKLISPRHHRAPLASPFFLKSQVPVGDRRKKGGIVLVESVKNFLPAKDKLFQHAIDGHLPAKLLAETRVNWQQQWYVSISFDTGRRCPVIALSPRGGTGISQAATFPVDPIEALEEYMIRNMILAAGLPLNRHLVKIVRQLWQLWRERKLLLIEINPLFALADGSCVAGDAKIIADDHVVQPEHRPYVEMPGDIAVIASGGGASMINLDALLRAGGRPANYVEYSGNPRGNVVKNLTKQVLSRPGLKGCWVIGGTANFTDIHETLKGFSEGLAAVRPKPAYPIVIRRDGPRRAEAFTYLEQFNKKHHFNLHLFGPETPMAESAKTIVKLAYEE